MSVTVDTNVLVYASNEGDPVHGPARAHRAARGRPRAGLPVLARTHGLRAGLRIVTHPAVLPHPLPPRDAIGNVTALLSLGHVRAPGEGDAFWDDFRKTAGDQLRGNDVPDAHLAALMREHGVTTIYTRDRDLRRFDGIRVQDPSRDRGLGDEIADKRAGRRLGHAGRRPARSHARPPPRHLLAGGPCVRARRVRDRAPSSAALADADSCGVRREHQPPTFAHHPLRPRHRALGRAAGTARQRRGRDSNPRCAKDAQRFSRPPRSTAPAPLRDASKIAGECCAATRASAPGGEAVKSRRRAAHPAASTPPVTSGRWLRRGSARTSRTRCPRHRPCDRRSIEDDAGHAASASENDRAGARRRSDRPRLEGQARRWLPRAQGRAGGRRTRRPARRR